MGSKRSGPKKSLERRKAEGGVRTLREDSIEHSCGFAVSRQIIEVGPGGGRGKTNFPQRVKKTP